MIDLNDMIIAHLKESNASFPDVRRGVLIPMVRLFAEIHLDIFLHKIGPLKYYFLKLHPNIFFLCVSFILYLNIYTVLFVH